MKKVLLAATVLFMISCSKKDTAQNSSMTSDSLASDSAAAIPNPAPQTDSATGSMSGSNATTDSTATSPATKKDSAR